MPRIDDHDLGTPAAGTTRQNEPGIPGSPLPPLFGRERELAAVCDLLDGAAPEGTAAFGAALLVRACAGAGKSSLLAAARAAASMRRMKVLTITGTPLEAGLPFACLHQVIQPVMDRVGDLPPPQRDAVLTAFGMSAGAAPNPLFVALATLELLTIAAAGDPLLLLADDAQWIDGATSEVLAIIARRLEHGPVILIAAARTGHQSALTRAGLPELGLGPLGPAAARALLDESFPGLTAAERGQVLKDAEGNPLALAELPGALRAGRAGYRSVLPTLPPLTSRLEQAFATSDLQLPSAARTLLLIAAASDGDDLDEVLTAGAAAGVRHAAAEALVPATAAGLITVTGSVFRFPHLLVRSAVYHEAAPAEREAAHAALAHVLACQPERAAWHAAAATARPDETAAGEMELAARRALRQGAIAAALAAAERAVALTPDPAQRGARLLRAAELACDTGRGDTARRLLTRARALPLRGADRTRLTWLQHTADPGGPGDRTGPRWLAGLADQAVEGGDHDLALSILGAAAFQCLLGGHDQELRQLVVTGIKAIPELSGSPAGLAALVIADPVGQGAMIIGGACRMRRDAGHDPADALAAGAAATIAGDVETGASFLAGAVAPLRAQGRLRLLARALAVQAWAATCLSDWNVAIPAAEEGTRLARETEQPLYAMIGQLSQLTMAALRGDEDATASLALRAERQLAPGHAAFGLAAVQAARGLSALGAARYEDAYEHLRRIFDPGDQAGHDAYRCWAIADLAEAAAHSGHRGRARAYLSDVERAVARTPAPLLCAVIAHARLVLADDHEAEERFEAAESDGLVRWPFLRARAWLAHGAWLRRRRRITESRRPLRMAVASFDALGAAPWAERARQELRAAGESAPAARAATAGVLSPQELQIAEMAAGGLSNREIGQQLYLSHRTVAAHLYRIFPKLGITSRMQMPQALRAIDAVQS
jgi:DNA-binding CsgD family transcriptional regulator